MNNNTGTSAGSAMKNGDSNMDNDEDKASATVMVTPDMLYKLSKKIAQLTKVIYSLNTRNDDLEVDLESIKSSYEEKLQLLNSSGLSETLLNGHG